MYAGACLASGSYVLFLPLHARGTAPSTRSMISTHADLPDEGESDRPILYRSPNPNAGGVQGHGEHCECDSCG